MLPKSARAVQYPSAALPFKLTQLSISGVSIQCLMRRDQYLMSKIYVEILYSCAMSGRNNFMELVGKASEGKSAGREAMCLVPSPPQRERKPTNLSLLEYPKTTWKQSWTPLFLPLSLPTDKYTNNTLNPSDSTAFLSFYTLHLFKTSHCNKAEVNGRIRQPATGPPKGKIRSYEHKWSTISNVSPMLPDWRRNTNWTKFPKLAQFRH